MPNTPQSNATLIVNKTTGAIEAPVSAATFKSANSLGGGTPEAHAASHAAAGADPVTLAQSQITGLTAALAAKADDAATTTALAGKAAKASNLSDLASASTARTNLGATAVGDAVFTAANAAAARTAIGAGTGTGDLVASNNLSDLASAATARTNLGLGNVNNTSDASKPVSTATQTALDLKAPLASPTFTGTPAVPTAAQGTNTTQAASTAFVRAEVAALVASAPGTLDTLDEIAAALGDDPNLATTLTTAIGLKADSSALTSHTSNTSNPHSVTKAQVGLSNADNTSDANKPVSTATQTALDLKAPLASPALTGTPTAPTASAATDNTQLATTAFVHDVVAALPGGGVTSVDGQTGDVDTGYDDRITALENVEPTASGSNLVAGGGVSLTGGLTLTVSAALYNILGAAKSSAETILTAATADATHPRYDVVALDDTGTAVLITGTPAATPVVPTVDPATQLYLTQISIPAGATSITGTETIIYDSNDDWTMSEGGTSVVLNSSNNPYGGSGVCIEATNMVATDYFQGQKPSGTIDLGTFNVLRFRIRNKAAWASAKQITITARNNGVQVGQQVVFKHGLHAFDQTNTTTYQHISLNTNLFAAGGQAINQLRWTCTGGGAAITGFYVDDIVLQAGVSQAVDSTRLRDRGPHDTGLQYDVNDLAYSGAIIYKALQQTPVGVAVTNTTYWAVFAMRNPMTTAGDSIVGGTSGAPTRLALGTSLQTRRTNFAGTAQEWGGPDLKHFPFSFNPKAVCDGTIDRLFLMTVGPEFPNGLKITRWNLSFDADPTTEADLDFKRADAFIGVANAAVMDVLDTTAGVSSETTAANINSDAAVANGKVLYLEFGTAYTADNLQMIFEFWGYAV